MKYWLVLIVAALSAGCCCNPCCGPEGPPVYCQYKVVDSQGKCEFPIGTVLCLNCKTPCPPRGKIEVGDCVYYVEGPLASACRECPNGKIVAQDP